MGADGHSWEHSQGCVLGPEGWQFPGSLFSPLAQGLGGPMKGGEEKGLGPWAEPSAQLLLVGSQANSDGDV